jgi:hypothetical protein
MTTKGDSPGIGEAEREFGVDTERSGSWERSRA